MHRQNIRALSLIVCTFTYLMIGAAIFDSLESAKDNEKRQLIDDLKLKMKDKYKFSDKDWSVYESMVIKSIPHKASGSQWKFAGAFYFATVVITTVGYGHSTPSTTPGKMFCIFYALAGIPLNLVMFQSIGERLNALICYCLGKVRKLLRRPNREVSMFDMILVSSSLGNLVVLLGTYLFDKYENWGYFDSFYYCFITLTTIGFGDFVALQNNNALAKSPEYVVFSLLFILFGMAIFAAAVNLLVLRFMATNSDTDQGEKVPVRTLVLESLSASDDEIPANEFDLNCPKHGAIHRASSFLQLPDEEIDFDHPFIKPLPSPRTPEKRARVVHSAERIVLKRPAESGCFRCFKRRGVAPMKPKKNFYTVKRAPGRISHLLTNSFRSKRTTPLAAADNQEFSFGETDSFLMREMKKADRRPSF